MRVLQIDDEEYGEALLLAQAYRLDADLVYQRQWRKTPVSVASIQDYLVGQLHSLESILVYLNDLEGSVHSVLIQVGSSLFDFDETLSEQDKQAIVGASRMSGAGP